MKIGIIGAGFTGLAAAYKLSKAGIDVVVFEKEDKPGGLASGFKEKNWQWTLDKHYHHWFTSDSEIIRLAEELKHKVVFIRPKTSTFLNGNIYQLDSPLNLMKFPYLSVINRLRTGLVIFYLRYIASWKALERFTTEKFLKESMGNKSWEVLWEPLFEGKFGKYAKRVSAAWFWARIKKRSPSLGYPVGGFQKLSENLNIAIRGNKGKISYSEPVESVKKVNGKFILKTSKRAYEFDRVISTLPFSVFTEITSGLPKAYVRKLSNLKQVGALNLVLSLKKSFLKDGTYWLNINEPNFPFLAVVEHTNYMDKKYYGNEHLVYVGNYCKHSHRYFKYSEKKLVEEFVPYLKKINPKFQKSWIKKAYLFKDVYAQPIPPLNYSKILPSLKTPIDGLFTANMQQVYPWDRGTNYAVQLGEAVAELVVSEW